MNVAFPNLVRVQHMHAGLCKIGVTALETDADAAIGMLQELFLFSFCGMRSEDVKQLVRFLSDPTIGFEYEWKHLVAVLSCDGIVFSVFVATAAACGEQWLTDDSRLLEVAGVGWSSDADIDVKSAIVLDQENICVVIPLVCARSSYSGRSSVVVRLSARVESHTACEVHERLHEVVVTLSAESSTMKCT